MRIKICISIGIMMFEIVKFCIRIFFIYFVCDFWRKVIIGFKNEFYSYVGCFFFIDLEIFVNEFFFFKIIL